MIAATIVVLAHRGDPGAAAVARLLAARHPVCVVCPEELAGAPRWSHAIDARGRAGGRLALASGTVLDAGSVACVLHRLAGIEVPAFARAAPAEREYAATELHALLMSWLAGLGRPVVNPVAFVLAPPTLRQWLGRAAAAGLRVADERGAASERHAPSISVLVAGDRVHGDVAGSVAERCIALARRSGCTLLELRFRAGPSGPPRLAEAEPVPSLAGDGGAHAAAVADLLARAATATTAARP